MDKPVLNIRNTASENAADKVVRVEHIHNERLENTA
jgi:hypothetical protein